MGAITILEIVLLIVSVVCFVVSFLIPEKKPEGSGIDQELAKEEVKEMVRQQVDNARGQVDDMVKESMDYAMEKTEISLERLSNEKIMAVNEYSDSVMQEIHKNHEEVVFLYDMLNNKHESLKKTVSEASRAAKVMQDSVESIQSFRPVAVSYGEGSVRIAPLAAKRKDAKEMGKGSEREDKTEDAVKESLKNWKPEVKPYAVPDSNRIASEAKSNVKNDSVTILPGHDTRPIFGDRAAVEKEAESRNEEQVELADEELNWLDPGVGDDEQKDESTEDDSARNKNDKILELHKQGKSNVDIAKELALGVGEVKLVIDLFQNA